jgi:hypothetical protein
MNPNPLTTRARRPGPRHGTDPTTGVSGVDTERVATEFLLVDPATRVVFGVTFRTELLERHPGLG